MNVVNGKQMWIFRVCKLSLSEGVDAYKKEGAKFIQRLVAKQKTRTK